MTKQLMDAGAEHDIVDSNGQTPVYYAIKHGRLEMVSLLLQKGIKVNHEDNRGQTPLAFAKKN